MPRILKGSPLVNELSSFLQHWKILKTFIDILPVLFIINFSGCNFSTQSYNFGKLLNPGEGITTFGFGFRPMHEEESDYYDDFFDEYYDTVEVNKFSTCVDFRLGLLSKPPFGGGLEFGLNIEYPGQFSSDIGPPVADFDLRMGIKSHTLKKCIYHHNIGIGWTVGCWIDNGWFAEYAAGMEFTKVMPYVNMRFMINATDITETDNDPFDSEFFTEHKVNFNIRNCIGIAIPIKKLPVLPDYISPELSIVYPNYSILRNFGFTFHIGFRWKNGI